MRIVIVGLPQGFTIVISNIYAGSSFRKEKILLLFASHSNGYSIVSHNLWSSIMTGVRSSIRFHFVAITW